MSTVFEKSLKLHETHSGKIEVVSKVAVTNKEELSLAYSPGVAAPCLAIKENVENVYKYTSKGNMVAVVTDGSAVLGLGNIGPEAALPVMEGKAILFKEFAGVDAFPICLDTQDTEEIIKAVKLIAPGFGGINLEDISAPRCVEIETRLKNELDIPVFHDDQHGTAIVVVAALINSFKIVNKSFETARFVVSGAGAAGSSIIKLLLKMGAKDIVVNDIDGIINRDEKADYNFLKAEIADITNPENIKGGLKEAVINRDVFIGVSAANILSKDMVKSMNKDAIVFAMANPNPEIMPEDAIAAGAKIVGTGRSDYPNQVNNVLAFPGIFRGALDAKAKKITEEMKIAAAVGIAKLIPDNLLTSEYVIPDAFDHRVANVVAEEVKRIAKEQNITR
ncbi:NAD(P)-dependent malic enzyme [Candidatus Cetobacterium colombiensis]|uniref:Malic enzyme-like NAD(P)-binding protein n=1 Tax=Candidatus Cetobacterium colombiensis TaxID=3073100 RepID=A0ABU4W9U0_9FUSO|nr:malic enzyme-like NAD(P)-binding protein [Candidatus Cetobacterium colombiensis]MDX8336287.1 malic enzyme-like NAD(P)-binding protein [Candidatus Cetobacterium colombiensis]